MSKTHEIKCWTEQFAALESGEKTFEFRLNDRDYQVGDTLIIREWDRAGYKHTGRDLTRTICHVLNDGFGLPSGYAVLGLWVDPEQLGMSAVGHSVMNWLDELTQKEGPLKDWTPAESPAEVIPDLYNMLEESFACHRQVCSEQQMLAKLVLEMAEAVEDGAADIGTGPRTAIVILREAVQLAVKSQAGESLAPAIPIKLTYTNWRGETSERNIIPADVWYGSTNWHPEPQWLLKAHDCEKGALRDFALKDFGKPPVAQGPTDEEDSCYACQEAFVEGDPIYYERDGGYLHAACCGPDRIAFYSNDEGPLAEGEPIPRPLIWTADQKKALPFASDEVNDDVCVNRFAAEMRGKLHAARRNGRSGWDDQKQCSLADLSAMLLDQVRKGDPLDVANFAMMLHQRGGRISADWPAEWPIDFRWIDKAITVTGGDYQYAGQLLCSFPKELGGTVRYIVRDQNRRLFIHNAQQCGSEVK